MTSPRRSQGARAPEAIEHPKLLLVEGADAYHFSIWALREYALGDTQVLDFGGVTQFPEYLKTLKAVSGYRGVASLGIARDAEGDPPSAFASVCGALRNAGFAQPDKVFQATSGRPSLAVFLFPGPHSGTQEARTGTLDDLCLSVLADGLDGKVMACVNSFLHCARQCGCDLRRPHKARLHALLAAHDKFVGLKVGEAANAGAWDWHHPAIEPFEQFLRAL